MSDKKAGTMIISLDFELMWGVLDHHDIHTYGRQVLGARKAVERILVLFEKYNIHATWAVVGFLFCRDKKELQKYIPSELPRYHETGYNAYSYIRNIGADDNAYYFAPELIRKIKNTRNQEIASHTFSHYYCLEQGQTYGQFEADIKMFMDVSSGMGHSVQSIVFPRNQIYPAYGTILKKYGIHNYRGTEKCWCYQESEKRKNYLIKRAFRMLDAYLNIFGHHCYSYSDITKGELCNMRSSRFLRPYDHRLATLEPVKIHRIKRQMEYAAKHKKVFHIWWHPHNFGADIENNMKNLEEILTWYKELKRTYGFLSLSMQEAGTICRSCLPELSRFYSGES